MSSFGNLLKKLRNEAGLSQQELADKMDVSTNTIQNWEKGTTKVDYSRFGLLADIFNTPVDSLISEFCREESEKRPNNWPGFLFDRFDDEEINPIIDTLHLNRNQQDLFGLLYIYNAEYLQKDTIDFNTIYDDLKLIPYEFIGKVGSIQFMNMVDGLQRVIKYVKSDFLLKILKQNPEAEFDVRRLTKEQICEFIDKGHKEADDFVDQFDDPDRYEVDSYFNLGISMERAKLILPILATGPIHITDGHYANKIRKDVPREIIESLHISMPYDYWLEKYDDLKWNDYGNHGACVQNGLERVTTYRNTASEGEEEAWYLEINEKGRSLLEWFNSKE